MSNAINIYQALKVVYLIKFSMKENSEHEGMISFDNIVICKVYSLFQKPEIHLLFYFLWLWSYDFDYWCTLKCTLFYVDFQLTWNLFIIIADACLQELVMTERVEIVVPIIYISTFIMSFYGPNAKILGNIKLTL